LLQGDPNAEGGADDLDLDTETALRDAIDAQDVDDAAAAQDRDPRLRPGDTMVIRFEPREGGARTAADAQQPGDDFLERLEEGNPYQLDASGLLYLPGVPAIPLAGYRGAGTVWLRPLRALEARICIRHGYPGTR
jgi:hypothetical protein